ncbi:MAG TPA: transposase [Blastocatellia bacterium]|nr:transposase [Blastocatellia bacterium]
MTSKAESAGRVVIKVNPAYTSQDCSQCGHRVRKTLAKREHRCDKCGYVAHRDHNSALAIKGRAGLSGMVSDGKSREPRISTYSRQA